METVQLSHSIQNPISIEKKNILVIDDTPEILMLNKIILEMAGYKVHVSDSARDALTYLAEHHELSLILLDVTMEDMSGPDFLVCFERDLPDQFKKIPVVFFSALDLVPKSKAVGSIRKPTERQKFLDEVSGFIKHGPTDWAIPL